MWRCGTWPETLHPDHDTIRKSRRENFEAVKQAFVQVLQAARHMGVLKAGVVSIDGTQIRANASKLRTLRHDRAAGDRDRRAADEGRAGRRAPPAL